MYIGDGLLLSFYTPFELFSSHQLVCCEPLLFLLGVDVFKSKSLQDLEGPLDRSDDPSYLVSECRRLYGEPISKLTTENLRMLVGQGIGLKYLVPVALDILEKNPLAGGKLYSGDLLRSVASAPDDFWASNSVLNNRLVEVKIEIEVLARTINEDLVPILKKREFQ